MYKTDLKEIRNSIRKGEVRGLLKDNHIIPGLTIDEMNGILNFDLSFIPSSPSKSKWNAAIQAIYTIDDLNRKDLDTRIGKAHK